jgi:sigma-B regulation protein RsbU (phosphoserine phosphatase)
VLEDLELLARSLLQAGDPSVVESCVARLDGLRAIVGSDLVDEVARSVQPTQASARGQGAVVVPNLASVPGIDSYALLIPKRAVTADFIEVVPKEGRLVVAIGDAPGSGLKSAFVARFIASLFRSLALAPGPLHLGRLLSQLSASISRHAYFERVSMQCLEFALDEGVVAAASAGHPYPVLYSARYQRCDRLPVRGRLLHARQATPGEARAYELRHAEIGAGDVVVLVSDGITEGRPGPDVYGYRFVRVIERHAGASAKTICEAILDDWRSHLSGEPPPDDAAILVLAVNRTTGRV